MTPARIRCAPSVRVCMLVVIGIVGVATMTQAQQIPPTGRPFTAAKKLNPLELPPLPRKNVPRKKFGDWTQRCQTQPGAKGKRCFLTQTVVQTKDKKKHGILAITIGLIGPEKKPVMGLRVPLGLGVLLPPGFRFNVPGTDPLQIVVQSCLPIGCIAKTPLPPKTIAAMQKTDAGSLEVHTIRKKVIKLPVFFKGFAAALASLKNS